MVSSSFEAGQMCVAFTVLGAAHVSSGGPAQMNYISTPLSNYGGGWDANHEAFIAPVAGTYFFTVSFVKDPFNPDDVYVDLFKNGVQVPGYAWAGETVDIDGTDYDRTSASFSWVLSLQSGDVVDTRADSDAGIGRLIVDYGFSGFLVTSNPVVAFTVFGYVHASGGGPAQLKYVSPPVTNLGGGWDPNQNAVFIAPIGGTYFFSASFVKEPAPLSATAEDVSVSLFKNGVQVPGRALAGATYGNGGFEQDRSSASFGWLLHLQAGDALDTRVDSQNGISRRIVDYGFSGLLLTTNPIADFMVLGDLHTSTGNADLLSYDAPAITNEGSGWNPNQNAVFIAPVAGVYFFTASFVKDPFGPIASTVGGVFVYLFKNGIRVDGRAWAGETPDLDRSSASFSWMLDLQPGDTIETWVDSDDGLTRDITDYSLSGALACGR
jgi:hypothetical protein